MEEVAKFSSGGKSTVGGRKWAGRILTSEGTAAEELGGASPSPAPPQKRGRYLL